MAAVLDSQLEDLFFNLLRFDFSTALTSLWTWVAVLAVALSFWRITNAPPPKTNGPPPPFQHHQVFQEEDQKPIDSGDTCASVSNVQVEGVTKEKFTVYLEEDNAAAEYCADLTVSPGNEEYEEICDFHVEPIRSARVVCTWESCQLNFVRRCWDLGLYRCQDLTAFNGVVVKLWDSRN